MKTAEDFEILGEVEFEGRKYVLEEEAYADNDLSSFCGYSYSAKAHLADEPDRKFEVTWYPKEDWVESESEYEDEACDWKNPYRVVEVWG